MGSASTTPACHDIKSEATFSFLLQLTPVHTLNRGSLSHQILINKLLFPFHPAEQKNLRQGILLFALSHVWIFFKWSTAVLVCI